MDPLANIPTIDKFLVLRVWWFRQGGNHDKVLRLVVFFHLVEDRIGSMTPLTYIVGRERHTIRVIDLSLEPSFKINRVAAVNVV